MKFNPNAYSEHPILRPNASDYPKGQFNTDLRFDVSEKELRLNLDCDLQESTISQHIDKGNAVYCAQVYCGTTCFSTMLEARKGFNKISTSISLDTLKGAVEVHPSVIALDDIVLSADTVHPEYGDQPIIIKKYRQLAASAPWYFAVQFTGMIESVFHLKEDSRLGLEDGEFEFDAELPAKYIEIRANPETIRKFNIIRKNDALTRATVFLTALTVALSSLQSENDQEEKHAEGWATALQQHLAIEAIDLQEHSIGLAAQRLLKTPFSYLEREIEEEYG